VSLARYFVFSRGGKWIVALDGVAVGKHVAQSDAVQSAIVMADLMGTMHHDADVMVEDSGQLDVVWTYGADCVPAAPERAA
jgi:hypothetical protein